MPTRLTLAGNGCNRGNPAGDHSMSRKGHAGNQNRRGPADQGKVRMVNAKLRELQSLVSSARRWQTTVYLPYGAGESVPTLRGLPGYPQSQNADTDPAAPTALDEGD